MEKLLLFYLLPVYFFAFPQLSDGKACRRAEYVQNQIIDIRTAQERELLQKLDRRDDGRRRADKSAKAAQLRKEIWQKKPERHEQHDVSG